MKKVFIYLVLLALVLNCTGCSVVDLEVQDPPDLQQMPSTPDSEEMKAQSNPNAAVVADLLAKSHLEGTATPVTVYRPELYESSRFSSLKELTAEYALIKDCTTRESNPIAAFRVLVDAGLIEADDDGTDVCRYLYSDIGIDYENDLRQRMPSVSVWDYPYTSSGCRKLLEDILWMCHGGYGIYDMAEQLLQAIDEDGAPAVHYSESDACYYGYFIYYGDNTAHVLCAYMRSGDGALITDVEFQFLNMRYFFLEPEMAGWYVSNRYVAAEEFQIAALIMATELLLTGQTVFDSLPSPELVGEITAPKEYILDEYTVHFTREKYVCEVYVDGWYSDYYDLESNISNYRIRK